MKLPYQLIDKREYKLNPTQIKLMKISNDHLLFLKMN